jgi:hypothetical protein
MLSAMNLKMATKKFLIFLITHFMAPVTLFSSLVMRSMLAAVTFERAVEERQTLVVLVH